MLRMRVIRYPTVGLSMSLAMETGVASPQARALWKKGTVKADEHRPLKKTTWCDETKYFKWTDRVSRDASKTRDKDSQYLRKGVDKRFHRKLEDYSEVRDNDPMAAIFGERASVAKERLRTWRDQYERENWNQELPYLRVPLLNVCLPNFIARWVTRFRENVALNPFYIFGALITIYLSVGLYYESTVPKWYSENVRAERDII